MNKHTYTIIIVLMLIASIGIGVVQYLWVNNIIHVNERQFERNVYAALKNIVLKLEKQSYAITLNGKQLELNDPEIETSIFSSDDGKQITVIPLKDVDSSMQTKMNRTNYQRDKIQNKIIDLIEMYNQVKVEIESQDNPLERIDFQLLDSIIYKELLNTGIRTDYEFAVVDKTDEIIFNSEGFFPINVNSRYRTNLFPTDITYKEYYLILDVSLSDKYGFDGSFYGIMIASTIISLFVSIVFLFTVRIILKQKKLDVIKTDFINNITHELKTPLSTLKVAMQTLIQDESIKDKSTLELIHRQGDRLQMITDRVLESSFNNVPKLNKEVVQVQSFILKAIDDFKSTTSQDNVVWELVFNVDPETTILADKRYLSAALDNILENAILYNDKNKKLISCNVSIYGKKLSIEVQDNGTGITDKDKKRIFDKFYRSTLGNIHNVKGLGIGLFMSKQFIELHNGSISFESKLNIGTKFLINIPVNE